MSEAVQIKLALDNAQLSRDLAQAQSKIKRLEKSTAESAEKMGYALGSAFRTGLAAAGTAVATALVKVSGAIADMNDKAQQLGMSFKSFQVLKFAAIESGVGIEKLNTALAKMEISLGKMAEGGKDRALKNIGLAIEDIIDLSPDEQFIAISKAISAIENPAQKAAAAQAIFGRGATTLIPLMEEAAGGMAGMTEEAERFGVVIDENTRKQMQAFDDKLEILKLQTLKLLSDGLTPLVTYLNGEFGTGMSGGSGLMRDLGSAAVYTMGFIKKLTIEIATLAETQSAFSDFTRPFSGSFADLDKFEARVKSLAQTNIEMKREIDEEMRRAIKPIEEVRMPPPPKPSPAKVGDDEGDKAREKAAQKAQREREKELEAAKKQADKIAEIFIEAGQSVEDAKKKLVAFDVGGEDALEVVEREIQLREDLKRLSQGMNDEQKKQLEERLKAEQDINAELEKRQELAKADKEFWDDMEEKAQKLREAGKRAREELRAEQEQMLEGLGKMIGDTFASIIDKTKTAKEAFKDLLEQILKAIVKAAILAAFNKGSFGSNLSAGFGGGFSAFAMPSGMAGGGPTVRIYNYASEAGGIKTQTQANGDIDVIIGSVTRAITRGGNPLDTALRRSYGLGRQGT